MQLTQTHTIDIPLTLRPSPLDDEALSVFVGDWSWQGPIRDVPTALRALKRTERQLQRAFEEHSGPRPHDTYSIAIGQALTGMPVRHPGTEALREGRLA